MSDGPLVETRFRVPLRIAAVFAGYLLYRWVGDARVVPGIMVAAGAILIVWAIVDELTLIRKQRLGLLQVGSAVLGLGLLGLGAYLTWR
jgi:hypothetical protein